MLNHYNDFSRLMIDPEPEGLRRGKPETASTVYIIINRTFSIVV